MAPPSKKNPHIHTSSKSQNPSRIVRYFAVACGKTYYFTDERIIAEQLIRLPSTPPRKLVTVTELNGIGVLPPKGLIPDTTGKALIQPAFAKSEDTGDKESAGPCGYCALAYVSADERIVLLITCSDQGLTMEWRLTRPGDLSRIKLRLPKADHITIDEDGCLRSEYQGALTCRPAPTAWQTTPQGKRRYLNCDYAVLPDNNYTYSVTGADDRQSLIING